MTPFGIGPLVGVGVGRRARHSSAAAPTIALSGTVTTATEAQIVAGGLTIILTVTGDTWVAAGAAFNAQRQAIINGLTSAGVETNGWNAQVKANLAVTDVVRTSATVVTITLDAEAGYAVTANETITATVPGAALAGGTGAIASPTFTVLGQAASAALTGTVTTAVQADIVAGGKTIILTLAGDIWIAAGAAFNAQRQAIINGLVAGTSQTNGWNNQVVPNLVATNVVRTSASVVTITLPAIAGYAIATSETITATIPGAALQDGSALVAAPTFAVSPAVVVAPVLESFSADIGIAAGGTKQQLYGYNFSSGTVVPTFNGVAGTSIVIVNDSLLTCLTPAGTASETKVDVAVTNSAGTSTLAASYEYGAVNSATQASEDFHSGGYGALTNDTASGGTNTIINVPFARGTTVKCVQSSSNGTTAACVDIAIANNTPLNATHGQFVQYDMAVPSATLALIIANGQIKNSLFRPTVGGSSPAHLMLVAGVQATGAGSQLAFPIDIGIAGYLGSINGCLLGDNNWQGIAMQATRPSGGPGRMRVWRRGPIAGSGYKLVAVVTSANIGGDVTTTSLTPSAGCVFTQAALTGTLNVLTANFQAGNGWLEPLNT